MIAAEELREMLTYDPATGVFVWRVDRPQRRVGDIAGSCTLSSQGYRLISVKGTVYRAHRLAWLYVYGAFPTSDLDHIDGDRDNNRIANLRLATKTENSRNRRVAPDNATGFKGVTRATGCKSRFQAHIGIERRLKYLGSFGSAEEAHAAYVEAAKSLYGAFARAA